MRALRVAEETHNEVRQSILSIRPSEMTAERFSDGLRKYATNIGQSDDLQLVFDVKGDFERLSPQARRGLYRIAQEALANAAHCADVRDAVLPEDAARLAVHVERPRWRRGVTRPVTPPRAEPTLAP